MTNVAYVMPGPGEPLRRQVRAVPEPGPGEAVVRVRASSLNYHDLMNLIGFLEGPWPRVPMTDGAGEVVAVGPGVREVAVGQRVLGAFHPRWLDGRLTRAKRAQTPGDTGDGWLQQYVVFPANALTPAPAHLDDRETATLGCAGITAWNALETARIRPGDVVVAQGTGGVSCFAVQLAKARGATVVLTSSSDAKLEVGKALGADHLVNYRTTPDWERAVLEVTDGEGADLVLDVGGVETLRRSVTATRPDGTVAVIGVLSGAATEPALPLVDVMLRQVHVVGVTVGSVQMYADLTRAVSAAGLRPHISHTFSWTELDRAQQVQQAQEHLGKIAITID